VQQRWTAALGRAVLAAAIIFMLAHVPLPQHTPEWVAFAEVPILMFILMCYLGKLLYDTLFWDRYH
jgi:hypothetical protein